MKETRINKEMIKKERIILQQIMHSISEIFIYFDLFKGNSASHAHSFQEKVVMTTITIIGSEIEMKKLKE